MGFFALLIGSLTGAGLMYFLDPITGKNRRSQARDRLEKMRVTASERVEKMAEDAATRMPGASTQPAVSMPEAIADEKLVAMIRSELEHYTPDPHAVAVTAKAGVITLTGYMLAQEMQPFVDRVQAMSGVKGVENKLEAAKDREFNPGMTGA